MAFELILGGSLLVDDRGDFIGFGGVGLDADNLAGVMTQKIVPAVFLRVNFGQGGVEV